MSEPPGQAPPSRASRAAVLLAVSVAVFLILTTTSLPGAGSPDPAPAGTTSDRPHLPTRVDAPGAWSHAEGPDGPLAALGIALRTWTDGLIGQRQTLELFGVSAVDGGAAWVELPGVDVEERALVDWYALSPDGRWLAWSRHGEPRRTAARPGAVGPGASGPLLGWALMDTTTGEVRELADAAAPRRRVTSAELAFSGDSRYLLVTRDGRDRFVAWDVEDGTPTVLEGPGEDWLPNVGSAPDGVVWSRGATVHRVDPATGKRASYMLGRDVLAASWAPDGAGFAYLGRAAGRSDGRVRLYAGSSLAEARDRALPLDVQPGQLLGWRDPRHVVVGHYRRDMRVVDVVSGEVVTHDLAGAGKTFNPPLLAADLWRHPLAEPVERVGDMDPRRPYQWGGGVLAVLLAVAWVRRRHRPGTVCPRADCCPQVL